MYESHKSLWIDNKITGFAGVFTLWSCPPDWQSVLCACDLLR